MLEHIDTDKILHHVIAKSGHLQKQFHITRWQEEFMQPGVMQCFIDRTLPCTKIYEQKRRWLFFSVKQYFRLVALYPEHVFGLHNTRGIQPHNSTSVVAVDKMEMRHDPHEIKAIVELRMEDALDDLDDLVVENSLTTWQVWRRIIFRPRAWRAMWKFKPQLEPHVFIIW